MSNIILSYNDIKKEISAPDNYKELCDSFLREFNENEFKNFYIYYMDEEGDEIQIDDDFNFSEIKENDIIYFAKGDPDEGRLSIGRNNSKSFHEKSNNEFTEKLEEVKYLISKRDENNDNDNNNNDNGLSKPIKDSQANNPDLGGSNLSNSDLINSDAKIDNIQDKQLKTLEDYQNEIENLKQKYEQIKQKNKNLNQQITELKNKKEEKEEENAENEEKIKKSKLQIDNEFETQKKEIENEFNKKKEEIIEEFSKKIEKLKNRNEGLEKEANELKNRLNEEKDKKSKIMLEKDEIIQKNKDLEEKMKKEK